MKRPTTSRQDGVSDWTLRLAEALDPHPGSNEALWYILETFRAELLGNGPSTTHDRRTSAALHPNLAGAVVEKRVDDRRVADLASFHHLTDVVL
jgi:hypothetical protein